jgi:hypothetical protein
MNCKERSFGAMNEIIKLYSSLEFPHLCLARSLSVISVSNYKFSNKRVGRTTSGDDKCSGSSSDYRVVCVKNVHNKKELIRALSPTEMTVFNR